MKCYGVGRFIADPFIRTVKEGQTHICKFGLSVQEQRIENGKNINHNEVFNFVVWDKAAELIAKTRKRGDWLYFEAVPRKERFVKDDVERIVYSFRIVKFMLVDKPPYTRDDHNKECGDDLA